MYGCDIRPLSKPMLHVIWPGDGLCNVFYERALALPFDHKEWARLEIQKTFGQSRHSFCCFADWCRLAASKGGKDHMRDELLRMSFIYEEQTQESNTPPLREAVHSGLASGKIGNLRMPLHLILPHGRHYASLGDPLNRSTLTSQKCRAQMSSVPRARSQAQSQD